MIKITEFLKIQQIGYYYYVTKMKVKDILENYTIDYYDSVSNENGYQRPIQLTHVNKLVGYLVMEDKPILNTGIVGAVYFKDIKIEGKDLVLSSKIRVVDGQHRLEALKRIKENYSERYTSRFAEFELVLIIIPSEEDKLLEVETFININNKNKRVSTALAEQLMERIRKSERPDIYADSFILEELDKKDKGEIISAICNGIVNKLSNDKNGIWYQTIKLGDTNNEGKTISINLFITSLRPVVNNYIQKVYKKRFNVNSSINDISKLLDECWKIVYKKWPDAFNINYYNIQKGIGVCSLHGILCTCIDETSEKTQQNFDSIINRSKITSNDWIVGGKFSPYNSRAGFKEIENLIKADR